MATWGAPSGARPQDVPVRGSTSELRLVELARSVPEPEVNVLVVLVDDRVVRVPVSVEVTGGDQDGGGSKGVRIEGEAVGPVREQQRNASSRKARSDDQVATAIFVKIGSSDVLGTDPGTDLLIVGEAPFARRQAEYWCY